MSSAPTRRAIADYLRLLGNPYAKTQIEGFDEELEGVSQRDLAGAAHADEPLRDPTAAEREYVRNLGNQYAILSVAVPSAVEPASTGGVSTAPSTESSTKGALSKADFVDECRRIFVQYIPSVEKGRLRPHHRHFITRNQNRASAVRYALAHHLRRYDISNISGAAAQFNRERDELTDHKLKQIERLALSKQPQK